MKPGNVVLTKSVTTYPSPSLQVGYKPPQRNEFFYFLFLGTGLEGGREVKAKKALNSFGWLSLDQTAEYAKKFSHGEISAGKFGELLGLKPGELHDFKKACKAFEEKTS